MKYKYEFPVHPISEIPKREFRYVYINGLTSVSQPHEKFRLEERNSVSWIYVKAEKTPILENGRWYLVKHNSWEAASVKCVKCYSRGKFYDFFDADENAENQGVPVENYIVIAEMQEVTQ